MWMRDEQTEEEFWSKVAAMQSMTLRQFDRKCGL